MKNFHLIIFISFALIIAILGTFIYLFASDHNFGGALVGLGLTMGQLAGIIS